MADSSDWLAGASANPAWDLVKLLTLTAARRANGWEAKTARKLELEGLVFSHETSKLAQWLRESDWAALSVVVEVDDDAVLDEIATKVFALPMARTEQEKERDRGRANKLAHALWSRIADVADRDTLRSLQAARSDLRVEALLSRVVARLEAVSSDVEVIESQLKVLEADMGLKRWRTPLPSTFLKSPGVLLVARHRVIPYIGRKARLDDLAQWLAESSPLSMRFISGRGGSGKTGLAGELCRIAGREGWTTGFLADNPSPTQIDRLAASTTPRLVVVDYAETRSNLADLIERLDAVANIHHPCRVLVLERQHRHLSGPIEVTRIRDEAGEPVSLDDEPLSVTERHQLFEAALAACKQRLKAETSSYRPDLSSALFERVLMVAAAAVIVAGGGGLPATGLNEEAIFARLVEHETRYWAKTSERRSIPVREEIWGSAVTAGTIFGWTDPDAAQARNYERELAGILAEAHVCAPDEAHPVACWLLELYPGGRLPLDPLADHLIRHLLTDDMLAAGFTVDDRHSPARATPVLTRVAQSSPPIEKRCDPHASESLAALVAAAKTAQGSWTVEPLRLSIALATHIPPAVLEELSGHPIHPSLRHAAADVEETRASGYRGQAAIDPAFIPDLASSLNNLAIRYSELGRRGEALPPAEEATTIYRELAATNPAFIPDLASSLNNLANRYSELGRGVDESTIREEISSLSLGDDLQPPA